MLISQAGCPLTVIKGKNRGKKIRRSAIIYCSSLISQQALLKKKEILFFDGSLLVLNTLNPVLIGSRPPIPNFLTPSTTFFLKLQGDLPDKISTLTFKKILSRSFNATKLEEVTIEQSRDSNQMTDLRTCKFLLKFNTLNKYQKMIQQLRRGIHINIACYSIKIGAVNKKNSQYQENVVGRYYKGKDGHPNNNKMFQGEFSLCLIEDLENLEQEQKSEKRNYYCKSRFVLRNLQHTDHQDFLRLNPYTCSKEIKNHRSSNTKKIWDQNIPNGLKFATDFESNTMDIQASFSLF